MVAVAVAQDEAVNAPRIDAEQVEIAVQDLRRVAEIQQILRLLPGAGRLQVQGQAPFRRERGHLPARNPFQMIDDDVRMGRLRHEAFVFGVDDDPDRQLIDDRGGKGRVSCGTHGALFRGAR